MDERPDEPGKAARKVNASDRADSVGFTDSGKLPFVKVAERLPFSPFF